MIANASKKRKAIFMDEGLYLLIKEASARSHRKIVDELRERFQS